MLIWFVVLCVATLMGGILIFKGKRSQSPSLYDRLHRIYGIAALIDHFLNQVRQNPEIGEQSTNPVLREWYKLGRNAGHQWLLILWLADRTGGPYFFLGTQMVCEESNLLKSSHCSFHLSSTEFDVFMNELRLSLDHCGIDNPTKQEVLVLFLKEKSVIISCPSPSDLSPSCQRRSLLELN